MAARAGATSGTAEEALRHGARLLAADPRAAAAQAREILRVEPVNADAHRLLGAALRSVGDDAGAEEAELAAISASVHDAELMRAAHALVENDLPTAERLLRPRLKQKPTDVAAIRMMAELAARVGRLRDAENLLIRALELAPRFSAARANLATILYRQNKPEQAVQMLDGLLDDDPENAGAQSLKAASLGRIGGYEEAIGLYEQVLARFPRHSKVWMSYGHLLKTVGRRDDSVAAYRKALEASPQLGEAWWSLANLKTVRLDKRDVDAMTSALELEALDEEDRFHLHFALGKALEDAGQPEASFRHYSEGNRLRREMIAHDPEEISSHVRRCEALFTRNFFEERAGQGCQAPDPIFIIGMPRSGSTLIEQILASHPQIEGTMELPDMPAIARELGARPKSGKPDYLQSLASIPGERLRELGEEFLARTRIQRKSDRPFFIDKLPNNWMHIGLIQLILPKARIIDARRHPLDCCFSNFKQHYARGQGFSYDQEELGRFYSDYVRLLDHFDRLLPGRIRRVFHEDLLEQPEREVRALLAYLDLPFDEACLRFHENDRAVRTASSEQVRRPLNREGVDRWRDYEAWLDRLKEALGPVLDLYPEVPQHWPQ